jgi:hypothetical protein
VDNSLELQYLIELGTDNMIDGSRKPGSLSTAERLRLLLDRRRRWRELDWSQRVSVDMPAQCMAYELVGGSFAKTMVVDDPEKKQLMITKLPSRYRNVSTTIHEDLGVPARDFAIDPSQDLLALLETHSRCVTPSPA